MPPQLVEVAVVVTVLAMIDLAFRVIGPAGEPARNLVPARKPSRRIRA
jgi:hypothetical protein